MAVEEGDGLLNGVEFGERLVTATTFKKDAARVWSAKFLFKHVSDGFQVHERSPVWCGPTGAAPVGAFMGAGGPPRASGRGLGDGWFVRALVAD